MSWLKGMPFIYTKASVLYAELPLNKHTRNQAWGVLMFLCSVLL